MELKFDTVLKEVRNECDKICVIPNISKMAENIIVDICERENIEFEECAEVLINIGADYYYNNFCNK